MSLVSNSGNLPVSRLLPSASGINSATNQLLKSATGTVYDGAGNVTTFGNGMTASYDAENRVVAAANGVAASYSYDGNGQRVTKTVSGTVTIFVYDALGQLTAEYTQESAVGPCSTCYLSWDHLGTTRMVTDQNGNVVARHDYMPFGEEIVAGEAGRTGLWGSSDNANQKFTGQYRDSETNLDFFNARYFGSGLGRFTSVDPLNAGADLSDPQTWNAYSYVRNNPLSNTDPLGLWLWNIGGCYFDTVALYTDVGDGAEFQGYDTQPLGCFDNDGNLVYQPNRVGGGQGSQQKQRPKIDCSHPPPMPPNIPPNQTLAGNVSDLQSQMASSLDHGFSYWLKQVWPGGTWDPKNTLGNKLYTAFGNVNFGATCNVLGLSLESCQRGAGAAAIGTALVSQFEGQNWSAGPGNPIGSLENPQAGGSPSNDNGMPDYGDQTVTIQNGQSRAIENQAVIAGYGIAAWRKACSGSAR